MKNITKASGTGMTNKELFVEQCFLFATHDEKNPNTHLLTMRAYQFIYEKLAGDDFVYEDLIKNLSAIHNTFKEQPLFNLFSHFGIDADESCPMFYIDSLFDEESITILLVHQINDSKTNTGLTDYVLYQHKNPTSLLL